MSTGNQAAVNDESKNPLFPEAWLTHSNGRSVLNNESVQVLLFRLNRHSDGTSVGRFDQPIRSADLAAHGAAVDAHCQAVPLAVHRPRPNDHFVHELYRDVRHYVLLRNTVGPIAANTGPPKPKEGRNSRRLTSDLLFNDVVLGDIRTAAAASPHA